MSPLRAAGLVAVVLTLVPSLTACTSDPADPAVRAPDLPELELVWQSDAAPGTEEWWTVGSTLVVAQGRTVTGLDRASGRTKWKLRLPGDSCMWSEAPNDAWLLAVGWQRQGRPSTCTEVGLVDLASGKLRWQRHVHHPADYRPAQFDGISTGDRTVVVTASVLAAAVHLDLLTGRTLSVADDAWRYVSDGRHVVVAHAPATGGDSRTRVTVFDQDSGERVSSYPTQDSYDFWSVLADPLVLGTERGHWGGHQYVGEDGQLTGRGPGYFTAVHGGRIVSAHSDVLVANDLATGEEELAVPLDLDEEVLGLQDGSVVTIDRNPPWLPQPADVVRRIDLGSPEDPVVLGTAGSALGVLGDLLLATTDRGVAAFALPADGPATSEFERAVPWSAADLRPDEVVDACLAVSGDALATVGLDPHERANGSCWWGGGEKLSANVTAEYPSEDQTAVEAATELTELVVATDGEEIPGIGDEAWVSGDSGTFLTVRYRNVVIDVFVTADESSPARTRQGALAAARDIVAELERRAVG